MSERTYPEPVSIVDRAINALSSFGVTTEREAGQLLPMWLHYREMTAADRNAVYQHYRKGAPAVKPSNPDRRCHRCGATSGLRLTFGSPLTLDYKQYECVDGCQDGDR